MTVAVTGNPKDLEADKIESNKSPAPTARPVPIESMQQNNGFLDGLQEVATSTTLKVASMFSLVMCIATANLVSLASIVIGTVYYGACPAQPLIPAYLIAVGLLLLFFTTWKIFQRAYKVVALVPSDSTNAKAAQSLSSN